MANERQLTPEEIEQYRAYGRALLQPQEVKHPFMGLANILNALSGRAYLDHAGANEFMNRTTRGSMNLPSAAMGGGQFRGAQTSSYPPQTGAIPPVPQQIQQPPQPTAAPLQQPPQIGPFDATTMPEQEAVLNEPQNAPQGITPQETLAPPQLSPRVAEMFGTNTLNRRQPSPIESAVTQRYGANFLAEIMANPNAPVVGAFHRFNKPDVADRLFMESLPQDISGTGVNPDEITGSQWLQMQLDRGPQPQPQSQSQPSPGRMNLGAPIETDVPLQPASPASPDPGLTPGSTSIPFRRANEPPRTNSPTPNVPSRGMRVAQANIPSAEDGIEQFAGGVHFDQQNNDPTLGFPERIPVNTSRIQALERQLSNAAILPLERLTQLEDEYAKITQPIGVKTQFGTAFYDARTGEFVSSAVQPYNLQTEGGTVPMIPSPGGQLRPPQFGPPPGRQPAGGGRPGASNSGQDINNQVPPHPFMEGNVTDPFQAGAQWRQHSDAAKKLLDTQRKVIDSAIEDATLAYQSRSTLETLNTLTQQAGHFSEGGPLRGPLAEVVQRAKQFLSNFMSPEDIEKRLGGMDSLPAQEAIRKIIIELGSAATRQLSNRPANFEFQTMLQAFPGMDNSYAGANMITGVLLQIQDRQIELAELANRLPVNRSGEWNRIVNEHYRSHPIIVEVPDGPWLRNRGIEGPISITTQRPPNRTPGENNNAYNQRLQDWANGLGEGMYFMRNGQLYQGGQIQ